MSQSTLLSLAPELVQNIIDQLGDSRDLANARLTCKTLDQYAVKSLFRIILVSPEENHLSTWKGVGQNETLRQLPRHAIIHTQIDIEDEDYFARRDEVGEEFESALDDLAQYPNLESVEIQFTPNCLGGNAQYWQEVDEDWSIREKMLELIFSAIERRAADEKNKTIRKLTIINLQNYPLDDFTSSDLFCDVMGRLEELHLSLIQEYNEPGPDHDYNAVELQIFPDHLCSAWLKPISGNLKALSIYSRNENWGPFPGYFDPSDISFPKLEKLALGYYTLAHDNDLDWILSIKSLRKLILHNCMIASWIRIYNEQMADWDVRTHDWARLSSTDEHASDFVYSSKWSQYFDRIALGLPNLEDFRFDQGGSYNVKSQESCGNRVFSKRYICFDNGILPTHWPEADGRGVLHSWLDDGFPVNKHQENLEADQNSLERLLQGLRSTRV